MPNHVVGRDELVTTLVGRLRSGNQLALSAEGLPGVGKTTLAIALAHHRGLLQHFRDGVLWAGLGRQPDVLGTLASWGEALGRDVTDQTNEADRAQAVKNAIGQRRLLLVIDDAWDIDAARFLRCGGPFCCHLLTTRHQDIARAFAGASQVETVPVLEEDPAFELLQTLAPEACAADPAAARELAGATGGLPLVLELLGGYLAVPERGYFRELATEALAALRDPQHRLQLACRRLGALKSPAMTLRETIELSLADLPVEVVAAFYALGAFAAKPEPFDLEAARAVTEADARTLALLVARNLVEKVGERLALHQTLADVARTQLRAEAVARHRGYYLDLVNRDREAWRHIEAVYGQIQWAWGVLRDDETVLNYVWALGVYQKRRGLWREYVAWAKRGLRIAEGFERRNDVGTLLNNIGAVYDNLGRRQEALEYYQRALPITEEVGDRAGLATTLNNIGLVYNNLGRRQEALDSYQRALPTFEEVGDRAGESVTRYNIAMVYRQEGCLQEAVAELKRVVELDVLLQHPDLEQDKAMLAQVEAEWRAQQSEGGGE
ncbi:MAG: tetratricopeptide repeat protein [Ardenticatenaceae bacterium]|nr:tetratricopeptide repeat protein [Ardenticatenaceae bacterium]